MAVYVPIWNGVNNIGFFTLYEKLKLYCESNPPGIGKIIGMKMIQRLEKLETDGDNFPEYQIGMIRELIGEY